MDSRTCSILLNLNLDIDANFVVNNYQDAKDKITQSANEDRKKAYKSLRSTVKESFLTGSLKYGHNFIM